MSTQATLALVGGTVIDGTGAAPAPGTVLLRGNRIAEVGLDVAVPDDADVLDASGRFVVPGFIDSHAHFEDDVEALLVRFLAEGVTSVGNTGCDRRIVDPVRRAGEKPGAARGFSAGPAITAPGGYPSIRGGDVYVGVDSPRQAVDAVDGIAAAGADFIKLALEPFDFNFRDPGTLPVLGADEAAAATARAHELGLVVRAHVHYLPQLATALAAGVDSIEHVLFPLEPGRGYVELHAAGRLTVTALPRLPETVAMMAEAGVFVVPTVGNELNNIKRGLPETPQSTLDAIADLMVAVLGEFHQAGGRIALGDDWVPIPGNPVGLPTGELEYLRRAGLSDVDLVRAGTGHAAAVCGQPELGTLTAGSLADVVVLDGDAFADLTRLRRPHTMIKDGLVAVAANR
jgi:imidazolonepropionase-like amidohydrolase